MRTPLLILAVVAVAVIGGCGGDDDGDDVGASGATLEGVQWVLSSGDGITIPQGVALTASFTDGRVAGSGGCNQFTGPYTVDGEQIEIGMVAATQMACADPAVDAAERAYFDALGRADGWRIEDGELVLDAGITEVLRYGAGTPQGEWTVTALRIPDAVASPIQGTTLTATFGTDGSLSGSAGCNRFTGSYTADGDRLTILAPATTKKLCPTPEGVMEQEQAYVAALAATARFQLGGGTLTLLDASGANLVVLTSG